MHCKWPIQKWAHLFELWATFRRWGHRQYRCIEDEDILEKVKAEENNKTEKVLKKSLEMNKIFLVDEDCSVHAMLSSGAQLLDIIFRN